MNEVRHATLGETWLAALRKVYDQGIPVGDETRELLALGVAFQRADLGEPLLERFSVRDAVEEMRKVFFSTEANRFGHSYADKLVGPAGRRDLSDVIELLSREPDSKRAVATLVGGGDGKVPCVNAIHFLRRRSGLFVHYFARGQDMFRKFAADAVCIHDMAQRVAAALAIPIAEIAGTISSAHVYTTDLAAIDAMLREADGLAGGARTAGEAP